MFHLSFTWKDLVRTGWTFAAAFIAAYAVVVTEIAKLLRDSCTTTTGCDWSGAKQLAVSAIVGALAAAFTAAKNGVLADGTLLKG